MRKKKYENELKLQTSRYIYTRSSVRLKLE